MSVHNAEIIKCEPKQFHCSFNDVTEDAYNSQYSGHQLNPKNEGPHKDQQALQKAHQEVAVGDMEQSTKRH